MQPLLLPVLGLLRCNSNRGNSQSRALPPSPWRCVEAPSPCAHPIRCQLLLCHCLTDSKGGWLSAQNLFFGFFQGHLATAASQGTTLSC